MIRATTIRRRLAAALSTLAIVLLAAPALAADVDGDGLDSSLETAFGTLDTVPPSEISASDRQESPVETGASS